MLRLPYTDEEIKALEASASLLRSSVRAFLITLSICLSLALLLFLFVYLPFRGRLEAVALADAADLKQQHLSRLELLRAELWHYGYGELWPQAKSDLAALQKDVLALRTRREGSHLHYPQAAVLRRAPVTSARFIDAFDEVVDKRVVKRLRERLLQRNREYLVTRLRGIRRDFEQDYDQLAAKWRSRGYQGSLGGDDFVRGLEAISDGYASKRMLTKEEFPWRVAPMLADPTQVTRMDPAYPARAAESLRHLVWLFLPDLADGLNEIEGLEPLLEDPWSQSLVSEGKVREARLAGLPPPNPRFLQDVQRSTQPPFAEQRDVGYRWLVLVFPALVATLLVAFSIWYRRIVGGRRSLSATADEFGKFGTHLDLPRLPRFWIFVVWLTSAICVIWMALANQDGISLEGYTPFEQDLVQGSLVAAMLLSAVALLILLLAGFSIASVGDGLIRSGEALKRRREPGPKRYRW